MSSSSFAVQHLDIFVPDKFFECMPTYVFGICKIDENNLFINCTFAFQGNPTERFLALFRKNQELVNQINSYKPCMGLLCLKSDFQNGRTNDLKKFGCPTFIIEGGSGRVQKLLNWNLYGARSQPINSNIISYNSENMYNSELITSGLDVSFINFIFDTWELTKSVYSTKFADNFKDLVLCADPPQFPVVREVFTRYMIIVFSILCRLSDLWIQQTPKMFQKVLKFSTTGKQIVCKSNHLSAVLHDLTKNKKITLLSGNLLSALILDAAFGLIMTCCFQGYYFQPVAVVEAAIDQTDFVVDRLQQLLYWLMGVPAGLKLNLPLNSALGSFFLYHIYLWKTYIELIKPFLLAMLELSTYFGILGLSFLISVCTDLISLATLHIYCFYGYAARIYSLKLLGLFAFWRLFRGKKCNPLRNRVDSYTYDVQQLFLGTLIFTVLLFLLPTLALYYTVFSVLRLLVLFLQMAMCKVIDILTSFPLYAILLHLANHPSPKGDVRLKVISSNHGSILLSLEVISVALTTVLQKSLPDEQFCSMLGPKEILNKVVLGDFIYPL